MKIKQKIVMLLFAVVSVIAMGSSQLAFAAQDCKPDPSKGVICCGGTQTSIIGCDQKGGDNATARDTGVWGLLLLVLNIMTAGIGIAAVGGIAYGAFLYTTSSMSAEQTQKAKDTIRNVVIGVIAYGGMYLILNFLIPGGIFT